jgi:hypothetical protein
MTRDYKLDNIFIINKTVWILSLFENGKRVKAQQYDDPEEASYHGDMWSYNDQPQLRSA